MPVKKHSKSDTSNLEKPQIQPARGQRWRHKRLGLEGTIQSLEARGGLGPDLVNLDITDDFGCMTWRSTVRMFVERWDYVGESR